MSSTTDKKKFNVLFQKPTAVAEEVKEEKAPSPAKKAKPPAAAGAAAATGGADIKEIVFSFDTTGSMYPCLTQVQKYHEVLAKLTPPKTNL